jgi:CIC family chloride channel protein
VHVGAGLASLVGSGLRLGQENRKLLVAVGAAGGISAVFNAPLTGSFFALEVVLRRFTVRNFSAVVLGAVLANVVYRGVLGNEAALRSPAYTFDSGWEIFSYAALGIGTAIVAIAFVRGLYAVETFRDRIHVELWAPAIGGALVGVIGVWHGQILGTGTEEIAAYLQGTQAIRLLLILVVLKVLATSLTLGSGGTGGVFMPSLFLGAAFGGAFGGIVNHAVPGVAGPQGAYAVAGMAGVFAAAASAPITSLLLAFEVSQDYGLVVPLMVVVVISTAIAQLFMKETVYSEGLRRIGIDVRRERAPNRLQEVSVGDVFVPAPVTIPAKMPIEDVRVAFAQAQADILPVVDGERLVGMLSTREVIGPLESGEGQRAATAADVMAQPPIVARPDESLHIATLRMDQSEVRALAVVDNAGRLLGLLGRGQVVAAYARTTPAEQDETPSFIRELEQPGGKFLRVRVAAGGNLSNKSLRELAFPEGALIVSIRRDGKMMVPRGSFVLHPGDQLLVLAEEDALPQLRERGILASPGRPQSRMRRLYRRLRPE